MIRVTVDKSDDETWECNACGARAWTEIEAGPSRDWRVLYLCDSCLVEMRAKVFPAIDRTERGAKVGRRHPVQAKEAAARVRVGSQMAALLAIVARTGRAGATSADAQQGLSDRVGHHVSRNNTAAAMLALRERGLVEPAKTVTGSPLLRSTGGPNQGQVWVVTDQGRAEHRRIHS